MKKYFTFVLKCFLSKQCCSTTNEVCKGGLNDPTLIGAPILFWGLDGWNPTSPLGSTPRVIYLFIFPHTSLTLNNHSYLPILSPTFSFPTSLGNSLQWELLEVEVARSLTDLCWSGFETNELVMQMCLIDLKKLKGRKDLERGNLL